MEIFTVCFFGHREINQFDVVEEKIDEIIRKLIQEKEYVDFLVGRNGEFDQIVASCILKAKRDLFNGNFSLNLILPYATSEYLNDEKSFKDYYDDIEVFSDFNTYFKSAFQKRNRQMVNRSDLCIFYVEHNFGGAYQTLKYAISKKKSIINIINSL
ncbi:MAG: hypothetical protein IKI29_07400 [Clostridia bacterium]|nr:hypothetical protein [Clostridia bacterium]